MTRKFDCDPEAVLSMQELEVGVDDILQYCHALLTAEEISRVIRGLEQLENDLTHQMGSLEDDEAIEAEVSRPEREKVLS